jgi:uncharacterized membrane protein
MDMKHIVEFIGNLGDLLGVLIIAIGTVWGGWRFLISVKEKTATQGYEAYRLQLVRTLLLGLEVLVAADIIRTVAVSPSLNSVAVLAAIVVIRTFLSWSLILEIEGRWPWQKKID